MMDDFMVLTSSSMQSHTSFMNTIKLSDGFHSQKLIVVPDYIVEEYGSHPLVKALFISDIGYFPHALYHYRERPQGCGAYILIYCTDGEGWISVGGGKQKRIAKGTLAVIPAHTPHVYGSNPNNPWSIFWLHFQGEEVPEFFRNIDLDYEPLQIPVKASAQFIVLFDECYDILLRGHTLNNMIYVSQVARHLIGLICYLQGQPKLPPHKSKQYIEDSIEYMTGQLEKSVTLKELAHRANLSVPHYVHLFKKATGYSPIDYYLRMKMQLAGQYLDLSDLTVKQISSKLGFNDPYYFSKLFNKIMGQSPTHYRNKIKG